MCVCVRMSMCVMCCIFVEFKYSIYYFITFLSINVSNLKIKSFTYQQVCHIVEMFVPHQTWNIEKCLNFRQKPVNLQLENLGNLFGWRALKFSLLFPVYFSCSTSSLICNCKKQEFFDLNCRKQSF